MTLKKEIIKEMTVDKLNVTIFDSADIMANAASSFVKKKINSAINKRGFANIILATGSSQLIKELISYVTGYCNFPRSIEI